MIRILCSAMNETLAARREEVQRRREALGWTQNELARRIRKSGGMVSKVLNGTVTSSIVWARIFRALEREERRRETKAAQGSAA